MTGGCFRIFYADGSLVEGENRQQWMDAPSDGVQVVVLSGNLMLADSPDRFETGYVFDGRMDRQIFTGVDNYDPLVWARKSGTLIQAEQYRRIYELASGDN